MRFVPACFLAFAFSVALGSGYQLLFDPYNGVVLAPMRTSCAHFDQAGSCSYDGGLSLVAIAGFTTTFEILQSFAFQASLGFRVPYMPEGMPSADHFDTYWGNLAHPIDFTQAHPLQCGYPAAPPHVGDYLAIADTVPTPASGQGVYYVTTATHQGATRYGRWRLNGHTTGRDPALLPACGP